MKRIIDLVKQTGIPTATVYKAVWHYKVVPGPTVAVGRRLLYSDEQFVEAVQALNLYRSRAHLPRA